MWRQDSNKEPILFLVQERHSDCHKITLLSLGFRLQNMFSMLKSLCFINIQNTDFLKPASWISINGNLCMYLKFYAAMFCLHVCGIVWWCLLPDRTRTDWQSHWQGLLFTATEEQNKETFYPCSHQHKCLCKIARGTAPFIYSPRQGLSINGVLSWWASNFHPSYFRAGRLSKSASCESNLWSQPLNLLVPPEQIQRLLLSLEESIQSIT